MSRQQHTNEPSGHTRPANAPTAIDVCPFRISIPELQLVDLQRRLHAARLPDQLEDVGQLPRPERPKLQEALDATTTNNQPPYSTLKAVSAPGQYFLAQLIYHMSNIFQRAACGCTVATWLLVSYLQARSMAQTLAQSCVCWTASGAPGYTWRKAEQELNSMNLHLKAIVNGLDIHFVHTKAGQHGLGQAGQTGDASGAWLAWQLHGVQEAAVPAQSRSAIEVHSSISYITFILMPKKSTILMSRPPFHGLCSHGQ